MNIEKLSTEELAQELLKDKNITCSIKLIANLIKALLDYIRNEYGKTITEICEELKNREDNGANT